MPDLTEALIKKAIIRTINDVDEYGLPNKPTEIPMPPVKTPKVENT